MLREPEEVSLALQHVTFCLNNLCSPLDGELGGSGCFLTTPMSKEIYLQAFGLIS